MLALVPTFSILGQPNRLYPVDRTLARAGLQAADLLFLDPREEWVLENCWRDLRVEDWDALEVLRQRLGAFVQGSDPELELSAEEYGVLEALLDCREALVEEEAAGAGERITRTAALVAIAGGVAALVGLLA